MIPSHRCLLLALCILFYGHPAFVHASSEVHLAVEFVDHAACAHIARNKHWYQQEGLNIKAFDSYATGMALSAALSRGDIDAAYICLFPAINAFANANVRLKIVAGTHLYGYGLVVNPSKVKSVEDLSSLDIRLGCTSEGSPPAALLHKLVEHYSLSVDIINRARRMPPPKLLLSLESGQIDAAFMPEQYPSMGASAGFKELVSAADLWPGMQGSVLVVTEKFLERYPETVKKLVAITVRGIAYINDHPEAAARIVASELNVLGKEIQPLALTGNVTKQTISPEIIHASLRHKLKNTPLVDPEAVQSAIDYAARIGYIRHSFPAALILDLTYLHE